MFSCSDFPALRRRIGLTAGVLVLSSLTFTAMAQTDATTQTDDGHSSSSSTDYKAYISTDALMGAAAPASSAPSPQYGGGNYPRYPQYQNRWSRIAFEAGGGFTAPIGNETHGWQTWGYNVNVGAGWNFTKRLGVLLEYNFDRQKIPGSTLTALYNDAQASGADLSSPLGGNVNIWAFTVDPIFYMPFSHKSGAYVTGGGGFYRKVTNFTELEEAESCYYYCYIGYEPATVAHSSSNQGGLNFGVGFYHKVFGEDSNAKLYAEARYVWVDSPDASASDIYGSGTSGSIPVTVGLRF